MEDKYNEAKAMCPLSTNLSLSFVEGTLSTVDSIGAEVNDSTFSDLTVNDCQSITDCDTLAFIDDTAILL